MMRDWLWIVVVIVGVLAAGMVRERWRMRAMERFAIQHGFTLGGLKFEAQHPLAEG